MKFSSQLPYILTISDLYLTPIYILLIFFIVRKWSKRYYADSPLKKYILPALICRMAGCIFLTFIFHFYYGYGDTFSYYTGAREVWQAFVKSPAIAWELIVNHPKDYSSEALQFADHSGNPKLAASYYSMFKISGVTGLLCFGSYLPIALVFSLLSFWGTWMIFLVFNEAYPHLRKYTAITTLFMPSIIVWSNTIMKEPLCMFALGLCFYAFNNILKGGRVTQNLVFVILGSLALLNIKDYIFYIFFAAACFWSYKSFINRIVSRFFRIAIKGFIYLCFLIGIIYFFTYEDNQIQQSFTNYFRKAENLQSLMVTINKDYNSGSGYTLPTNDFSPGGMVQSFLLSLNVAFFRPYFWECTNPLMLLSFLESFATTLFIIFLLFKAGVVRMFQSFKDPLLLFSLIFSLIMAALVGFISFNFGTLIRYKTPFEPFFYTMLVIIAFNKLPFTKSAKPATG